jgi:hypothetical protein
VSSYLAFSPLPALFQRTGGLFSVTLSVNARFRERRPRILRGMLPYGVRTFLQQIPQAGLTSDHLPSTHSLTQRPEKKTAAKKGKASSRCDLQSFFC